LLERVNEIQNRISGVAGFISRLGFQHERPHFYSRKMIERASILDAANVAKIILAVSE
jgi:hypothetical protein